MPQRTVNDTMEQASEALVLRDYHRCEHLCLEALASALAMRNFERMSRIVMPLQEARRQKRQVAESSGRLFVVGRTPPTEAELADGVYLIHPPRVAAEGRALREHLDRLGLCSLIVTREPTDKAGRIPIVAIGPRTVRIYLKASDGPRLPVPASKPPAGAKGVKHGSKAVYQQSFTIGQPTDVVDGDPMTTSERFDLPWLLWAHEQLGEWDSDQTPPSLTESGELLPRQDGAITDTLRKTKPGVKRVEQLYMALQTLPEHDRLHQVLAEACHEASLLPVEVLAIAPPEDFGEDEPLDATDAGDEIEQASLEQQPTGPGRPPDEASSDAAAASHLRAD